MITHGSMETFQQRLHRIQNGKTTGWTEPGGGLASGRVEQRLVRQVRKRSVLENLAYPLSYVWAAFFGILAVVVSRYVRYHIVGMTDLDGDPDKMFLLDLGMGVAVGFVLTMLFKLDGKHLKVAQAVGVFAMVGLMHNLVWWFPDQIQLAFGPDYVEGVLDTTVPNSFLFRGNYFVW